MEHRGHAGFRAVALRHLRYALGRATALGGDFTAGSLLRTADGGATWAVVDIGEVNPLSKVFFPNAEVGYALFYGYEWSMLKTTDGGLNWSTLPIQPLSSLSNMEGVYFQDADTGYAGGWYLPTFLRTTDGGASWSEVDPQFNVYSIALRSPTHGIAVGWQGSIRHMTNGADWTDETWGDGTVVLYGVTFASDAVAVAVGENGLVLRWASESTGIRPVVDAAASITLRPNPATDFIELHSTTPIPPAAQLELLDASGRVVQHSSVLEQSPIDVSGLQAGYYTALRFREGRGAGYSGNQIKPCNRSRHARDPYSTAQELRDKPVPDQTTAVDAPVTLQPRIVSKTLSTGSGSTSSSLPGWATGPRRLPRVMVMVCTTPVLWSVE